MSSISPARKYKYFVDQARVHRGSIRQKLVRPTLQQKIHLSYWAAQVESLGFPAFNISTFAEDLNVHADKLYDWVKCGYGSSNSGTNNFKMLEEQIHAFETMPLGDVASSMPTKTMEALDRLSDYINEHLTTQKLKETQEGA